MFFVFVGLYIILLSVGMLYGYFYGRNNFSHFESGLSSDLPKIKNSPEQFDPRDTLLGPQIALSHYLPYQDDEVTDIDPEKK